MTTKVTRQRRQNEEVEVNVSADVDVEVEVEVDVEKVDVSFRQRLEVLVQENLSHIIELKSRVQELRKLQREHEYLLKDAIKKHKKKKMVRDFTKPRRSTGFAEPVIVSNELYTFLINTKATMKDLSFVPSNQEEYDNWPRVLINDQLPVARTDITSHLAKYIKEHDLQNHEARREIVPDSALKKIFSEAVEVSKTDTSKKVYTYLKLQTYVNAHFPKKQPKN
jgi:hypothetical protein